MVKITHGGIESETTRRDGALERLESEAIAVMKRLRKGRCGQRQRGRWRNALRQRGRWRNALRRRGTWQGAFGAALAFTLFFSLYPHEAVDATFSEEVQAFDWLFHALCYATLSATWLLGRAKRPQGLPPRLDAALAFASLGCALELAQALLPFVARSCTLSDASSNAIGSLLGSLLVPPERQK